MDDPVSPPDGELSLTAVVSTFPSPSQTFVLRKLQGLQAAGVDVTVAATDLGRHAGSLGFPTQSLAPWRDPVRAVRHPEAATAAAVRAGVQGLTHGARSWRAGIVQAPLEAADSDIVHVEFSGIAVTYHDALERLRARSRLAVSCRGAAEQIEPLRDPDRAAALARVFDQVDLIHCVSDDMRVTVEGFGAPPHKILVNRPAVPVSRYAPLRGPVRDLNGPLRVLSIGRLHWKKGLDDGLRAVAALRSRGVDVELSIIGDGPERDKLRFMVAELGIGDRVVLEGTRTQDEVRAALGHTDVLLLPSLSEGISNAVLEAMAAGRPVVTTDCGGMREVVTDGVDGLVVPVTDSGAMADRLALLAADADLRQRLGDAAAARADADFDLSRQVDLFLDAYRALVASGGSPATPTPKVDAASATTRSEDRPSR